MDARFQIPAFEIPHDLVCEATELDSYYTDSYPSTHEVALEALLACVEEGFQNH